MSKVTEWTSSTNLVKTIILLFSNLFWNAHCSPLQQVLIYPTSLQPVLKSSYYIYNQLLRCCIARGFVQVFCTRLKTNSYGTKNKLTLASHSQVSTCKHDINVQFLYYKLSTKIVPPRVAVVNISTSKSGREAQCQKSTSIPLWSLSPVLSPQKWSKSVLFLACYICIVTNIHTFLHFHQKIFQSKRFLCQSWMICFILTAKVMNFLKWNELRYFFELLQPKVIEFFLILVASEGLYY